MRRCCLFSVYSAGSHDVLHDAPSSREGTIDRSSKEVKRLILLLFSLSDAVKLWHGKTFLSPGHVLFSEQSVSFVVSQNIELIFWLQLSMLNLGSKFLKIDL